MAPPSRPSLRELTAASGNLSRRIVSDDQVNVPLDLLCQGTILGATACGLRDSTVLISTSRQLPTAAALLELDGLARRIVLCPPDLPAEHIPSVIATAGVDRLVTDRPMPGLLDDDAVITIGPRQSTAPADDAAARPTEWVLFTSGTTGRPKLVVHSLNGLTGAIQTRGPTAEGMVWSTFYDTRRYGGLQILLRALLGGASMVLSGYCETPGDFLARAAAAGVTHISGTPSHWRRALLSPASSLIEPRYVRMSGEPADKAILDQLRTTYRDATVSHAFASTEAGVAFDVPDGLPGFPASLIGQQGGAVEMRVEDGSLRIRSARTASRYLGEDAPALMDAEGFVDTGDAVELQGDRYYFVGRRDGIINVGGLKVHPEEVEAVINTHPHVRMSLVRARRSPITGAFVVADVVLAREPDAAGGITQDAIKAEITASCRAAFPPWKVPASIRFVASLDVQPSGKLARLRA